MTKVRGDGRGAPALCGGWRQAGGGAPPPSVLPLVTVNLPSGHPPSLPLVAAVSRIRGRSDLYEMDLLLDINVDVYPGVCGVRCAVWDLEW